MVATKKARDLSLTINYEEEEVAELQYDLDSDQFFLFYASNWMKNGFALSPHLPVSEPIPPDNTKKFLENLLPEGDGLKNFSRSLHLAPSNVFGLIRAMGRDATGAFSFSSKINKVESSFRAISKEELTERVRERATNSIAVWDNKPRLSLAGVQEKLGVTVRNGEYGFGEGRLASTHILKFSKKGQHLVLNEFFCMKLAEHVGLPVAKVEMVHFGERVLQVERFDRVWKGRNHVSRIHIIDGCQALNVSPSFKYQRIVSVGPDRDNYMGPINVKNLSTFNSSCRVPAKAQLHLLRWIIFNLVVGNTDNHGKNISYFVTKKGYEIAPAYDLVNITMYDDFHHELAFKIGDSFELNEVQAFQFAEMAQEMNLRPNLVATHLRKLCLAILNALNEIEMGELAPEELDFMRSLKENIKLRAERFVSQASLIVESYKSL